MFIFNYFFLIIFTCRGALAISFLQIIFSVMTGSLFVSCFVVLYFIIWAMAVTFKFYMVACAEQYKIQQAHAELRRQESVSAAGADQRGWLTRVKGAFSDEYSAERVNERRLARAEDGVAEANKV